MISVENVLFLCLNCEFNLWSILTCGIYHEWIMHFLNWAFVCSNIVCWICAGFCLNCDFVYKDFSDMQSLWKLSEKIICVWNLLKGIFKALSDLKLFFPEVFVWFVLLVCRLNVWFMNLLEVSFFFWCGLMKIFWVWKLWNLY